MSIKRSTRKAFGISLSLHVLFISFFIASALTPPPSKPIPHRLVVQSIALLPASRHCAAVTRTPPQQTAASPAAASAAKKEEPPAAQPAQKQEESGPSEAVLAAPEEPTVVAEQPSVPAEPTPPPQPTAKKSTHSAKAQPAKKAPPKPTAAATRKPSPSAKGKSTASSGTTTASKTTSKKSSSSKAPAYDQKLLSEALQRLDKSKSAAGKGSGSGGGSGGGAGGGKGVARVGAVGSLHVDQGLATISEGQDSAFEGYSSASPEACYIGDLIRRLQLNIRLPEPGEVRVKLSLTRTGTVTHVLVLSGKTASIKHAIEEKLRTIHFSPFGSSFSGEAEHTFSLRLSNELVWSCS